MLLGSIADRNFDCASGPRRYSMCNIPLVMHQTNEKDQSYGKF